MTGIIMDLKQFTLISDVDELFEKLTGDSTKWRDKLPASIWLKEGMNDFETTRFVINRYFRMLLSNFAEDNPDLHGETIAIRRWLLDQGEQYAWYSSIEHRVAPFLIKHAII